MAKGSAKCLFLLLLSVLTISSAGTLVGFSYHARDAATSSPARTISFLKVNMDTSAHIRVFVADHRVLSTLSDSAASVDLYLSKSLPSNLLNSRSSVISWLKTHVMAFLPRMKINSIIVTCGNDCSGQSELSMLLSNLELIHSVLSTLHLESQVRVSVALPISFLEKLNGRQERDLHRIYGFIDKIRSYVMVEDGIDGQLNMGDQFVQSMVERATLASSLLPRNGVPVVLTVKSPAVPTATEIAQFRDKVLKSLENNTRLSGQIAELYAEVLPSENFAQEGLKREEEEIFPSSHRELLSKSQLTTVLHDTVNPPTVFPTTPISTTPVITPSDNPTPTIVTIPANPATLTPENPGSTPFTVPSTTPITVPSTSPPSSPLPVTNPVTTPSTVPGAQPVTNPVTTYPAPPGGVPVTNPAAAPAVTNAPAVPGQSWCVAKTGASEAALQAALDYACGMGGADCSQIQQGGSCYDPNSLQNHASYAFNSYYQKNPGPTGCDFGGAAAIVNANPSTGSCIYPSASSPPTTTATPTPTTIPTPTPTTIPTPTPPTIPTPTPTTSTPPGADASGSGTPPTVLTTSQPASGIMPNYSPPFNSSTSFSSCLKPFIGCIVLVTSFVTRMILLDI
ncbi:uncharacterized protein PB18E9.04c isoform X1 [Carya illinoinensis]|uniref:X8 domain-containing protein n=2 Tax=Carya illinoinensis TaxID=32201 RepID=A0A922EIU9_CARIL|nr:uncharacterized protein PB18E9.04c isoform X1 [Carya illinoinensis]KAG6702482.1 hypothetical protein I3842_07G035600 [Carya illinoinensis]